jgi:hypothetical protein
MYVCLMYVYNICVYVWNVRMCVFIIYVYNVTWIVGSEFKVIFTLLFSELGYNERRVTAKHFVSPRKYNVRNNEENYSKNK